MITRALLQLIISAQLQYLNNSRSLLDCPIFGIFTGIFGYLVLWKKINPNNQN